MTEIQIYALIGFTIAFAMATLLEPVARDRPLAPHGEGDADILLEACLLYTSPSPRDRQKSRMPSSA